MPHQNRKTAAALALGSPAPVFSLPDASGAVHRIGEPGAAHGTVLFFYPGDMTPGCTMQLCAVRDDWKSFGREDITAFGVNHAKADSHARFSAANHFPFPLLIDSGMNVSKRYGATRRIFLKTVIKRTVVGINRDGRIVFYRHGMPKNNDILKAFTASAP